MATHPLELEAREPTCFTNQSSDEPWVLTPADAEVVLASWESPREPGEGLKAAYAQYMESVQLS
jgi:hypothetical protein